QSRDVVLDRPDDQLRFTIPLAAGQHVPRSGKHRVVVWDPRALELDKEPDAGLRRETLLADGGGTSEAGQRAHEGWVALRAGALAQGGRPAHVVATATEISLRAPGGTAAIESVERRDGARPGGKRF